MDKVIKVSNCQGCPFVDKSDYSNCNISDDVDEYPFKLPHDEVHVFCPLKQGRVIVELENNE